MRRPASGLVLCGGASQRMGSDKARLALGERSLLERASSVLAGLCTEVRLACGPLPRYGELCLPQDLDRAPGLGPLAGLEAGLAAAREEHVLAVAVDLPWLERLPLGALLDELAARGADACLLAGPRGLEPLCGAWSRSALPAIRAALEAGERRVLAPFERAWPVGDVGEARPLVLARVELAAWEQGTDPLANLNTPEEYARARAALGREVCA